MDQIPSIFIPSITKIETVEIPLPTADVPSYVPLVIPPSDLKEPEGTKPVQTEELPAPVLNFHPYHLFLYLQLKS